MRCFRCFIGTVNIVRLLGEAPGRSAISLSECEHRIPSLEPKRPTSYLLFPGMSLSPKRPTATQNGLTSASVTGLR